MILLALLLAAAPESQNVAKISEAMGHMIGENLKEMGVPLDMEALVRGLQESSEGKDSPMTEEACVQGLSLLQEQHLQKLSQANLALALTYLHDHASDPNTHALEEGKLLYTVDRPGTGAAVQSYNSPIVKFSGHYLNGDIIGQSPDAERISLDEVIPGLARGIVGMKEGEIRTLYIHPDLGYGAQSLFEPNALVIFQVEVIRAETPPAAEEPTDLIR